VLIKIIANEDTSSTDTISTAIFFLSMFPPIIEILFQDIRK
jgi:hypothetical protein